MDVLRMRARDIRAARHAAEVASQALGVPVNRILSLGRGTVEAAYARHVAMYLCHVCLQMSLSRIAFAFGRDRSSVAHASHGIEDRRDEPQFDLWIGSLETVLLQAPRRRPRDTSGAKTP
jgi:chromosomal replication initiation ATPase DnaA